MECPKYKVGDRIQIKEYEDIPTSCIFGFSDEMRTWCGKIFTIHEIRQVGFGRLRYIFENMPPKMSCYCWSEDMFDLVEEPVLEIFDDEIINFLNPIS